MDFDGKLIFRVLSPDVTVYADSAPEEILDRIQGACVVVTKELPVPAELIRRFPDSVKLICEAGTGYNNIALDAAAERGIQVCNVPAYSSHRVAHTKVHAVLNPLRSRCRRGTQDACLRRLSNFTDHLQVPHVELNGKTLGVIGAGKIGSQVIRIAQAMDMHVLCHARKPRQNEENSDVCSLEQLLGRAISSRSIVR